MSSDIVTLKGQPGPPAMVLDFNGRLARSAGQFRDLVWPHVSALFGPGRLAQVETHDSDVARTLDLLGIDYLFTPDAGEAFGIASRVQAPDSAGRPWDSFTMGARQYDRLRTAEAAAFGRLVPAVVIHAFVDHEARLLSVGVARVRDLLEIAPTDSRCGATGPFHYWSFDALRVAGRLIARLPDPNLFVPFSAHGEVGPPHPATR